MGDVDDLAEVSPVIQCVHIAEEILNSTIIDLCTLRGLPRWCRVNDESQSERRTNRTNRTRRTRSVEKVMGGRSHAVTSHATGRDVVGQQSVSRSLPPSTMRPFSASRCSVVAHCLPAHPPGHVASQRKAQQSAGERALAMQNWQQKVSTVRLTTRLLTAPEPTRSRQREHPLRSARSASPSPALPPEHHSFWNAFSQMDPASFSTSLRTKWTSR